MKFLSKLYQLTSTASNFMKAKRTHPDYVHCYHGSKDWFQAVLDEFGNTVILSKQKFNRGRDAKDYKKRVIDRLQRFQLRSGS